MFTSVTPPVRALLILVAMVAVIALLGAWTAATNAARERERKDVEYITMLARTFVTNNVALPYMIGTHDVTDVQVVCRKRVATPADNMTGMRDLNGEDECLATVTFTETFSMGGIICISKYFDTRTHLAPGEDDACPATEADRVHSEHKVHYGDMSTERVALAFVRIGGLWKYFPHAIVLNPGTAQQRYIAYRTN